MRKILLLAITLCAFTFLRSQEQIIFRSKALKCNDTVLVFTPKTVDKKCCGSETECHSKGSCCAGEKTCESKPLLFLLHGWSGDYSNWSKKTDLQAVADRSGFIIVTPDGFYNSWYLNNTDTAKMQWRTFFHNELYPAIKEKYKADPSRTFITGLSMGGHGALNIYMDDTSKFAAAGSMSGVLNLQETKLKNDQIAQILGPWSETNSRYDTESAVNRIERLKGTRKIVLITSGAQDVYSKSAVDFHNRAEELKVPNILILSPGVHSWKYWIYALDEHLRIFRQILEGTNMGY